MSMATIAIGSVAASVIGAGASIYSSNQQANAIQGAAGQSASMYNGAQSGIAGQNAPYQSAGLQGLSTLLGGFGMRSPTANLSVNPNTGAPLTLADFMAYNNNAAPGDTNNANDAQIQFSQYMSGGYNPSQTPNWQAAMGWRPGAGGAPGAPMGPGSATGGRAPMQGGGGQGGAPNLLSNFSMSDFLADPGYAFNLQQGMRGINQQAAARGNYYSPGTLMDLSSFIQGNASNEFQNAFSRWDTQRQQDVSNLMGIVGLGTGQTNVNVGAGLAGAQGGAQAAQFGANAGAVNAAGTMGVANALGGGANTYMNALMMQQLMQQQNPSSLYGAPYTGDGTYGFAGVGGAPY